jgi:hypothetical protein
MSREPRQAPHHGRNDVHPEVTPQTHVIDRDAIRSTTRVAAVAVVAQANHRAESIGLGLERLCDAGIKPSTIAELSDRSSAGDDRTNC